VKRNVSGSPFALGLHHPFIYAKVRKSRHCRINHQFFRSRNLKRPFEARNGATPAGSRILVDGIRAAAFGEENVSATAQDCSIANGSSDLEYSDGTDNLPGEPMNVPAPRICIVCQNASYKFGGEASLPWLCFKYLRQRGVDVHLVAHERTRPEVLAGFPDDHPRLHFSPDTIIERFLWRCGKPLPSKIDEQTLTVLRQIQNQRFQRRIVRRLIAEKNIQIVHEINPVSPRMVSLMYGLGVPVVIGPLAGGMKYPPAFRQMDSVAGRAVETMGRTFSNLANRLIPGKRRAAALIVANEQARQSLPPAVTGKIFHIPDVGVDLEVWNDRAKIASRDDQEIRFVYLGRLSDWKGVQFLIPAFKAVAEREPRAVLYILGDGKERQSLEELTRGLNLSDRVKFVGWVSAEEGARQLRSADVFVLPSLREVGGIVLLEAMAVGLPVITTNWGGPAIHVTDETGIRVNPDSEDGFVRGLSEAMVRLAHSPELRRQMGQAGMERVRGNLYDWNQKTNRLLEIYAELLSAPVH
jgi:glycosyltransferase involved in cell wall biosynthesis